MAQFKISTFLIALALFANQAAAHFPFFVAAPGDAQGKLVLSESLEADTDVAIDRLANGAKLFLRDSAGKESPLVLTPGEHVLTAPLAGEGTRVVYGTADFGVRKKKDDPAYLLVYYPKAILGDAFDAKTLVGESALIELVAARADAGLKFQLLVRGKPVADREIKIIEPGGEQTTQKTDAQGFTEKFARGGRYGAWAREWVDAPGKRGEEAYAQERLYATLVINFVATEAAPITGSAITATPVTSLKQGISSFGATALGDWLYIYGGHTATTHEYSTESVSGRFQRLNLRDPKQWEELPGGPILQGMNLVTYRGVIYRLGGMSPRNAPGTPKDNHSTNDVSRYDPAAGKWEALSPAPTERSSHDVALVGDKLYAIGGWNQQGKDSAVWPDYADVLDLSKNEWTKIKQPFVRRALIVTALNHDIFVLGGFDEKNQSQLDVDILDTRTNIWRKGPPVPGERRNGFAPAAAAHNGSVYLSVSTGEMFKLSADLSKWDLFAKATPRSVHRLVPDQSRILIVGGASKQKMVDLIEAVEVPATATTPGAAAAQ